MPGSLAFVGGRVTGHPYVAWGSGDPLVILPGLNDPLVRAGEHWWFDVLATSFCRRLSLACRDAGASREVYYISRPAGLPSDASTRTMAGNYVPVLDALDGGNGVDVLGISMGGFLAPALAARSSHVRSVTLALAADRLSPHGVTTVRKWKEWAACNEWQRVGRTGIRAVARGARRRAGTLGAWAWSLAGGPVEPDDFLVSAQACLTHEWTRPVGPPTLILGGTQDPFFTDAAFGRAAAALDARHARLDGWGHDVVIHGAESFDPVIAEFITPPD